MSQSSVEVVIHPKEKDLGDNFVVRRTLPNLQKKMVGPFVFWDHMGPVELQEGKDMTVRVHPHIGLATITYLFSGEILHRDSLGNEQWIKPGEVNWMTAGKGISHSERSYAQKPPVTLEGIQLWLALPKDSEEVEPSFVHHKQEELPMIEKDGLSLRLIAGSCLEKESPIKVYSDLFYLNGKAVAGSNFEMSLAEDQEAAIYVISGKIDVEGISHERFSMIIFKKGEKVGFTASEDSEIMMFGGECFPEGRHMWWNFVSSSKERIEKAKQDWVDHKFGTVPNETDRIPLPDK